MFEGLIRRAKGVVSTEALTKSVDSMLQLSLSKSKEMEAHVAIRLMVENPNMLSQWKNYFYPKLQRIGEANDRVSQMRLLRDTTIDEIEACVMSWLICSDKFSDSEQKTLASWLIERTNDQADVETYLSEQFVLYAFSDLARKTLQAMSALHFNDSRPNDWSEWYLALHRQLIEITYKCRLAENQGHVEPLGVMLPHIRKTLEQGKDRILKGDNWEFHDEAQTK